MCAVPSGPRAESEALALASAAVRALPAGQAPVSDPPWFPEEGRAQVRFARRNALGIGPLKDAYMALYEDGAQVVVADCGSSQAAQAARKEAEENFSFLGTAALFDVLGSRVLGVVGSDNEKRRAALLSEVRRRVEANP